MYYLKRSLGNAWDFLKGTQAYFRDVLLMHGFILFICLPLLSSTTRFILHRGAIDYLSYDNIPLIFSQHPGVLLSLIAVLLTILLLVYFEFAFLLMSVFFIKKKEPVSDRERKKDMRKNKIIYWDEPRIQNRISKSIYFNTG